jgi:cold shock CspA family protein
LAADIDTRQQLARAAAADAALAAWLRERRLTFEDTRTAQEPPMPQGTVKHFDFETNTGTILLDNQDELPLDAETFAASGLVELRLGQRVRFDIEEDNGEHRIRRLTVVSF